MAFSTHFSPPVSPILIGGIGLRTLPPAVFNPLLSKAMKIMLERHSDIFERLSCIDNASFAIDPTDLPFVFILCLDIEKPSLKAVRSVRNDEVTASIHGSFTVLTQLLEGQLDGDALVFSRDLVIEGDTEAVLALRNAVDGGDVQIKKDLASLFGPFSSIAEKAADRVVSLMNQASEDMMMLQNSANHHLNLRTEANSAQIEDLGEQIEVLKKQLNKMKKRVENVN